MVSFFFHFSFPLVYLSVCLSGSLSDFAFLLMGCCPSFPAMKEYERTGIIYGDKIHVAQNLLRTLKSCTSMDPPALTQATRELDHDMNLYNTVVFV